MFADDTNIIFGASTLIDLEKGLNTELRSLNQWLHQIEFECCEDRIYGYWVKPTFTFIL